MQFLHLILIYLPLVSFVSSIPLRQFYTDIPWRSFWTISNWNSNVHSTFVRFPMDGLQKGKILELIILSTEWWNLHRRSVGRGNFGFLFWGWQIFFGFQSKSAQSGDPLAQLEREGVLLSKPKATTKTSMAIRVTMTSSIGINDVDDEELNPNCEKPLYHPIWHLKMYLTKKLREVTMKTRLRQQKTIMEREDDNYHKKGRMSCAFFSQTEQICSEIKTSRKC